MPGRPELAEAREVNGASPRPLAYLGTIEVVEAP